MSKYVMCGKCEAFRSEKQMNSGDKTEGFGECHRKAVDGTKRPSTNICNGCCEGIPKVGYLNRIHKLKTFLGQRYYSTFKVMVGRGGARSGEVN
jgi:hypothetical protein